MIATDQLAQCQPGCGACCIAPEISSPLPGMPNGKPAGVRCIHLDRDARCKLFGQAARPAVCERFLPTPELCSQGAAHALQTLVQLEVQTRP